LARAPETKEDTMRTFATFALGLGLIALAACGKPAPKEYANPSWNFAASFVGDAKVTETKGDAKQPASLLVVSSGGGHDFSVYVMDASSASVGPDKVLASAAQALADSQDIDAGPSTPTTAGDVTGRQVLFSKNDKPAAIVRFFMAGGKLYEVNASVPAGAADPDAKAFLASFRLLTTPPAPAANTLPAANAAPAANATNAAD
jgi:hypothetical protein